MARTRTISVIVLAVFIVQNISIGTEAVKGETGKTGKEGKGKDGSMGKTAKTAKKSKGMGGTSGMGDTGDGKTRTAAVPKGVKVAKSAKGCPVPQGDYTQTCTDCRLSGDCVLECNCGADDTTCHTVCCTSITVSGGELYCNENGVFGACAGFGFCVEPVTAAPTEAPTDLPSDAPTEVPTDAPSDVPTDVPSDTPSDVPTDAPSDAPSNTPTDYPTRTPQVRFADAYAECVPAASPTPGPPSGFTLTLPPGTGITGQPFTPPSGFTFTLPPGTGITGQPFVATQPPMSTLPPGTGITGQPFHIGTSPPFGTLPPGTGVTGQPFQLQASPPSGPPRHRRSVETQAFTCGPNLQCRLVPNGVSRLHCIPDDEALMQDELSALAYGAYCSRDDRKLHARRRRSRGSAIPIPCYGSHTCDLSTHPELAANDIGVCNLNPSTTACIGRGDNGCDETNPCCLAEDVCQRDPQSPSMFTCQSGI